MLGVRGRFTPRDFPNYWTDSQNSTAVRYVSIRSIRYEVRELSEQGVKFDLEVVVSWCEGTANRTIYVWRDHQQVVLV